MFLFISATTIISCGNKNNKTEKTPAEIKTDVYTCPMKCNNGRTYDKPGDCPECGMKLEKVTKS